MKDPAFLFYSSDFLSGISDLTMEERGQYITLLCVQHQKGDLSEKTIRLLVGNVSVDVMNKFLKDDNGNFYNKRLREESEKRNKFTESRRNNGNLGGRPPKNKKPIGKPKKNHMGNHMGNENENENIVYKSFLHLSITVEDFEKLKKEYTEQQVSDVFDKIENYSQNTKYKSLYLTAKNWLKKEPKITDKKVLPKEIFPG